MSESNVSGENYKFVAYSPYDSFGDDTPSEFATIKERSSKQRMGIEEEPLFKGSAIGVKAAIAYENLEASFNQLPTDQQLEGFIFDLVHTHLEGARELLRAAIKKNKILSYTIVLKGRNGDEGRKLEIDALVSGEDRQAIENRVEFTGLPGDYYPPKVIAGSKKAAINAMSLDADKGRLNSGSRIAKEWIRLIELCTTYKINFDHVPIQLRKTILCVLCIYILDDIICSFRGGKEGLASVIMIFQKVFDMANLERVQSHVTKNELMSSIGKKAAEARHSSTTGRLKAFAISEFQSEKKWRSTLAASKIIFSRVQDYAAENTIPTLSAERGPKTVYDWLRESLKNN